jgi:hypothetical protein
MVCGHGSQSAVAAKQNFGKPNEKDVIIPTKVARWTVGFVFRDYTNEGYCLFLKKERKVFSLLLLTYYYFVLYTIE